MEEFNTELWTNKFNEMISKTIVHQCTNKDYEGNIRNKRDIVLLPDDEKLTVSQQKFFAFKVLDLDATQKNEPILEAHLCNGKKAVEECEEDYLFSLHTQVDDNNIIGSEFEPIELTTENIYTQFVKLVLILKNNNVVKDNARPWVIINPWIESYLLKSSEFIDAKNIADSSIREGAIGRIAGFDVLVSTNLTAVDGKFYVLAGTNEAITFASQLAIIENLRFKDSSADLVRG